MANINNFLNPFEAYTIPLDDWINEAIAIFENGGQNINTEQNMFSIKLPTLQCLDNILKSRTFACLSISPSLFARKGKRTLTNKI